MFCYAIEHHYADTNIIAKLHNALKTNTKKINIREDFFLLSTCQRIELYSHIPYLKDPLFEFLGENSSIFLQGQEEVYQRMLEICMGIRSQIVGEKFIFYQFKDALNNFSNKTHILYMLGYSALNNAAQLRKKYNFIAKQDYEYVSFKLLNKNASTDIKNLIIIGSGMLALAIAKYSKNFSYKNVCFITRSAKKQRKKESFSSFKDNIYSTFTIPEKLLNEPFHCIIATNNIDIDYMGKICDVINRKQCVGIVDMSSIPIFNGPIDCIPYTNMYMKSYLDEIKNINNSLVEQSLLISNVIKQMKFGPI